MRWDHVERYGWWPAAFVGFVIFVPLALLGLVWVVWALAVGVSTATGLFDKDEPTYSLAATRACFEHRGRTTHVFTEGPTRVLVVDSRPGLLAHAVLQFAPDAKTAAAEADPDMSGADPHRGT